MSPIPFAVQADVLEDGIHIFTVKGELDLNTTPELEAPLEETLSASEDPSVMVDLSECEFIDSTGIALIVRTWQRIDSDADGGGRLVLCCYNDQVQRLLKITGVQTSISTHTDREAALSELRGRSDA